MKLKERTILITGGTSGIGLELAKRLLKYSNTVIITGRDPSRLAELQTEFPGLKGIAGDISEPDAIKALHDQMVRDFPTLDVLINNAGIMRNLKLREPRDLIDVTREVDVDLSAPIRMVQQFLPHLLGRPDAAIINVSSGLAFVPFPAAPVYSAAKAGLHAYTIALRAQLAGTRVRVVELAPPGTDTKLFHGEFDKEVADVTPMTLQVLVDKALKGLAHDRIEIRPGLANILKVLSRVAPGLIVKQMAKASGYTGK